MIDGQYLYQALYPDKAEEIRRIILRGEIYKLVCICALIGIAFIFGHH